MMWNGNPWWSRVWTVQEAVLPPTATIIWGSLSIYFAVLETGARYLCSGNPPPEHSLGFGHLLDDFTHPVCGITYTRTLVNDSPLVKVQRWRYRDATEPLDKIYALFGLFPTSPFPSVQSCDYNTSAADLFTRVTYDLILQEENLTPLIGRRGEPQVTPGIPSWVIDFVCCKDKEKIARKWFQHYYRYKLFKANEESTMNWGLEYDCSEGSLRLRGLRLDVVVNFGDVVTEANDGDLPDEQLCRTMATWERILARFIDLNGDLTPRADDSMQNAFWRAILGGWVLQPDVPGREIKDSDCGLFYNFLRVLQRNELYETIRIMAINQAFFITAFGYVGMGPPTTQKGDQVWILRGGWVPFVLRPRSKHGEYTLVGDAYVHGIMNGEAVDKGEQDWRNISLY